ncbi:VOC family protein [Sphingomonas sp. LHG3406-1]|uniref:VOC family protein n=1 Tax=Sphingomonas sp. LHG3406-1 TaxID=2804617 RepID=UPI0026077D3B|nr:VOC family protein [Sphingomonas sp. LHG3406-1]
MANPPGDLIWFELLTSDPDAAQDFYARVAGWTIADSGMEGMDYRILNAPDGSIGGLMKMPDGGGAPVWLGYVGVDDVDRSVERMTAAGATSRMPAMTIEGVGRMAMLADPHGATLYVMRGDSEETSTAFRMAPDSFGHVVWAELTSPDPAASKRFYAEAFGWRQEGAMPMGPLGDYEFLHNASGGLGALMPASVPGSVPGWLYYFHVPDIDAAAEQVRSGGGSVVQEPQEIPGGDYSLVGLDPQGARFGLVGPRKA